MTWIVGLLRSFSECGVIIIISKSLRSFVEHRAATFLALKDVLKLGMFDHDCAEQKRARPVCLPASLSVSTSIKEKSWVACEFRVEARGSRKKLMPQGSCLGHTACFGKKEQRERMLEPVTILERQNETILNLCTLQRCCMRHQWIPKSKGRTLGEGLPPASILHQMPGDAILFLAWSGVVSTRIFVPASLE